MTIATRPVNLWYDHAPSLSVDDLDRIDAAFNRAIGEARRQHERQLTGQLPVPDVSDEELAAFRDELRGRMLP